MKYDVIIVGAGLAGLACANRLQPATRNVLVLEAADAVGGRVRTDTVDGFQLDRGFQVFLTSYPEAQQVLDYPALALNPFEPGALIRVDRRWHRLTDPWRRPWQGLRSAFSPIGTTRDKLRIAQLRKRVCRGTLDERWRDPETTTLAMLREAGFTSAIIEQFFRPFLGGIFLERELRTSSRMFQFVFRMFALGDACLPARGMQAIPQQLADRLPPNSIRFGARVERVQRGQVTLTSGEALQADAIVIATEAPQAVALLGETIPANGRGVTCLYLASDETPDPQRLLMLNGDGRGLINNVCVPSAIAPSYAPAGQHLISVTSIGMPALDEDALFAAVRAELKEWFGRMADRWRPLRMYRIPYALPAQQAPALTTIERAVRWQAGLYLAGDHRDQASIQGALVSGRRTAEAILADQSS